MYSLLSIRMSLCARTDEGVSSAVMLLIKQEACGAPVIASEVGGLGYLVQNDVTGYTVPDSDPTALCDKLSSLLGDVNLRESMGQRAAEYALDYAREKIAVRIVEVYMGLVGNKK